MLFILQSILSSSCRQSQHQYHIRRTFAGASVRWVRDRALDHAVEKEKNLSPLINLKNLIKSEPSKSIPLSVIADNKGSLGIPMRPADFVRRYRSVFDEFLPGGVGIHPHVRLTPEVLELDAEEQLIYQGEAYQSQAADRLLKLLMLSRINKVPLKLIDRLRWDLGLPQDYVESIVPQFPDYFQVSRVKDSSWMSDVDVLELVCWNSDLAVSAIEKAALKGVSGGVKGLPVAFPLQYSTGFEMDKKMKKWLDEWQKLPYISPYENAMHLSPKSDESDKWAVAVMHELLHILIPKKTLKENVLCIGEYMGLRSRFKRALLHHPGIFYISSKNRTHTVVLRDGYKRDLLIEKHQVMNMRYRYIHLMNTVQEAHKATGAMGGPVKQRQAVKGSEKGDGEGEKGGRSEEEDGALSDLSYSSAEEASDDDYDYTDEDGDEDEDESQAGDHRAVPVNRGRTMRKGSLKAMKNTAKDKSFEKHHGKTRDKSLPKFRKKPEKHAGDDNVSGKRLSKRLVSATGRGRPLPGKRTLTP